MNLRIRSLYQKLAPRRTHILLVAILVVALMPVAAHAGFTDWVMLATGKSVEWLVGLVGKLLIAAIDILGKVASYNSFGESEAVNIGWVVIRDIANMLFIVSLIVMSFATIVGWQAYRYSRLLGNLVLATVLVNFSKSIVLFLVDFSQVIMMTFVNALKPVLAGNLITGFGVRSALAFANSTTSVDINLTETVSVYALALILMIIALIVTLSLIIILVNRIIRLWVLIILAPFAFISNVMPGGLGSFNGDWWKKLGTELFVGPVLAFFLWLSLSIIFIASQSGTLGTPDIIKVDVLTNQLVVGSNASEVQIQAVASEIGSSKNLFNFIATIVLLMHSMTIAKTAAGFGGAAAGKLSGFINNGARAIAGGIGGGALKGLRKTPGALYRGTGAKGVVDRAVLPLAAGALAPLTAAPLIGGKFRKLRAKIQQRRDAVPKDSMEYIKTMTNEELQQGTEGRRATLTGVNERREMFLELMRRGKEEWITAKGMKNFASDIGMTATPDVEVDKTTGKTTITGMTENARNRSALEAYFEARDRMPTLYQAPFMNAVAGTPKYEAWREEFRKDLRKYKKNDFSKLKLEALQRPWIAQDVYNEMDRRDEGRRHLFPTDPSKASRFWQDSIRDASDPLRYVMEHAGAPYPLADVSKDRRQRFEEETNLRERLGLDSGTPVSELREGVSDYIAGNRTAISDGALSVINKQLASGKDLNAYKSELENFESGVESGANMSDVDYAQEQQVFRQLMESEAKHEGEIVEFVAGKDAVNRISSEIKRAQEQGRTSVGRFAADFEKLGLNTDAAGLNFAGQEKEELVPKLQAMYRKQLEGTQLSDKEIDAQVQALGDELQKTDSIALANTRRRGYSLGHVMRHENAHPETDKLTDADREEIFGTLSPQEQETVVADIAKRWGLENLPDPEKRRRALEEYFTEGLANFGRRDAIGSELDSSMVLAMKAKGVNLRSHQENLITNPNARAERDATAQQVREQETVVQSTEQKVNSQIESFKSTHPNAPSFSVDDLQNKLIAKDLQESGASSQELIDLHAAADALKAEKRRLAEFREDMKGAMQKRSGELFNKYRQAQEGLLKKWGEIDKKDYMGDAQQRKLAWTGVYESLGKGEEKMQKLVQQRIADWEKKDGKTYVDNELKERIGEAMEQIVNEELL